MSKNLFKRIATSLVLFIILLIVIFSHNIIFIISLFALCGLVCFEAYSIFKKMINKNKPKIHKNNKKKEFNNNLLFLNVVTFLYVFLIFFYLSYQIYITEGQIFFLLIISVCFFSDIGGYVVGKLIGGKKLTKISPNKTISGTIGSFIFSLIPLFIIVQLKYFDLEPTFNTIVLIILISFVSQLGDLFISYLKRKAKIKDTGKILPGHGGVLDRVDGIIFALPFSYFILKII
ncbi:phosphatidate cytidylyltransferase [Candidatus Pelagibacter ubique]|uniref:phosphatidate cytidylyltransferase n=1 Tax=Pelagibacter ubique TaxID=198252 RepID=UPI0003C7FC44